MTGPNPVMFIGIQPDQDAETSGCVFSGASGQYLRTLIEEIGFANYYLSNILKCRMTDAEGNMRNPTPAEMKRCSKFLLELEIPMYQPSYIVLLGELPLGFFIGKKSLAKERCRIIKKGDYKFVPIYNPAHIVRDKKNSIDKQFFEQDLRRIWKWANGTQYKDDRVSMILCKTYEEIDLALNEMSAADRFVIDIESYAPGKYKDKFALDPWHPEFKLLCVGFSYYSGKSIKAFCVPMEHPDSSLDYAVVREKVKIYLSNTGQKIIGQHVKWDLKVLNVHCDIVVRKVYIDTLIGHTLLTGKKGLGNLERMSIDYLDADDVGYKDIIKGHRDSEVTIQPLEPLSEMNMKDCVKTLELATVFEGQLRDATLENYYHRLQAPALIRLRDMEVRGMLVDIPYLHELNSDLERSLKDLKEKMLSYPELYGKEYNLGSNDHLNEILFKKFGLLPLIDPKTKKPKETKQGLHPVDQNTLKIIAKNSNCPFLVDFHEWKIQQKLQSTYVTPYIYEYIKSDGRVHGTFNQHITATGRLSGDTPNLQNLPVRAKVNLPHVDGTLYDATLIMRMFIAPPGWKLVCADYSQIELRVMAAYCKDPAMVEAFMAGQDIHKYMASLIYKIDIEAVTKEQRQRAKSINFGIIYGMTEVGLAEQIGITEKEAVKFIDSYLNTFPGIRQYMDSRKFEGNKYGYVKSLFGRRCYIAKSRDRNGADRKSINYPIQSTAGDINQLALIDLGTLIEREGLVWGPIDVIHDAIIIETPENEVGTCVAVATEIMETVNVADFMYGIPIKVDMSYGDNLAEAKGKE